MNRFLLLLFFIIPCLRLAAQDRTVSGKVLDAANDKALEGATVSIMGKVLAAKTTDASGAFSFTTNGKTTLTITFTGYASQTVVVEADQSSVTIRMKKEVTGLDEVVVIGYGKQSRKDITSSISSVNAQQISEMPVSNINMALQGRVPGLQITSSDNAPGPAPSRASGGLTLLM